MRNSTEYRARRHYRLRGYRILGSNVWAGGNELDFIVRRGQNLAFVEVKGKTGSGFGEPGTRADAVEREAHRVHVVGGEDPLGRALVHDAFAHRRKALARSLALARRSEPDVRERAREALQQMGHPADERAERLSPAEFSELAGRLAR